MEEFKNIEISNFRGIDHLKIDDFSRVNVLLGQNSSGKTSVLEFKRNSLKIPIATTKIPSTGIWMQK